MTARRGAPTVAHEAVAINLARRDDQPRARLHWVDMDCSHTADHPRGAYVAVTEVGPQRGHRGGEVVERAEKKCDDGHAGARETGHFCALGCLHDAQEHRVQQARHQCQEERCPARLLHILLRWLRRRLRRLGRGGWRARASTSRRLRRSLRSHCVISSAARPKPYETAGSAGATVQPSVHVRSGARHHPGHCPEPSGPNCRASGCSAPYAAAIRSDYAT